jgi:two-component system, LytTR family, response regulator
MKKVIIIDDEKDARLLIRQYLKPFTEFEIIAECSNGIEAVTKVNEAEPDVIFLDVQMPGLSGFQVVQQLIHIPKIIFTTAYDRYALKAFDSNAIDYLLKPYTSERFSKAIERITFQDRQSLVQAHKIASEMVACQYPDQILVECGNKLVKVDALEIYYLEADRDYTRIHTADKNYLSNYGIGSIELRLNPQMFLRIHRSYIVNMQYMKEVYKDGVSAQIVMKNDTMLNVSRSYMDAFKKYIY